MNSVEGRIVAPDGAGAPQSFVGMQSEMESELERRRKEWEKEVLQMQEQFFQTKINENQNNANNKNVNKTLDIHLPPSAIRNAGPSGEITEIGTAKTVYEEKPGGSHVIKFQFDMRGFDPRAISVRAEGAKLLVTAKIEQELTPGNKSTRQFTRQVDIPANVDSDELVSSLSAEGVLTVEAPVDESPTPAIPPPAYPAIEDDDIYYVTRSTPKEHYYSQIHQSSPFATDGYNLHSQVVERTSPRPQTHSYVTSSSYSQPEPFKMTRYYSDYQDPGPLSPNSRGEILRRESPKPRTHHTPVARANIPLFRESPGYERTTVTSRRQSAPALHAEPLPPRVSQLQTHRKSLPKVTIIREYETSNGDMSSTASSPTTKTSLVQEFDTSPRGGHPARERNESTSSSGEKIIYPTKYKKRMSASQSSDSESSFSASPPIREITPRQLFPRVTDHNANTNGHSNVTATSNHPNIITTEEGQRLKMEVNIGNNFKADEITVHLRYKKVIIRAVHEGIADGRTSRSEFSKEFDLPGPLEPNTVKAALSPNGVLYIGGSLMTNVRHEQVVDLVLCDMPTDGRACAVKY